MQLSVIIPVYNAEPWLRQCLDSVLDQTLQDIEVICIDDGSTDACAVILARYAAKDARIRVLTQRNAGQGAARNRGMETARGRYIYFMDADDELAASDALERVVTLMDVESLDLALFDADMRFDGGSGHLDGLIRPGSYIRRHDYSASRPGRQMLADMCRRDEWTASPPLAMMRTDMLESRGVRFPEGIVHEDNIFMLRTFLASDRAAHRPWRLYLRNVHDGSTLTRPVSIANLRGYLECWRFVRDLLLSDEGCRLPCRVRRALKGRCRRFKWHVCDTARRLGVPAGRLYARLPDHEAEELRAALAVSFTEMAGNAVQCLCDNGIVYTLKRILFGRRV